MPGRHALIVANGTYQDPKLSRLRTPTRDAEELARVLRDPEIGAFEVELAVDEPESVLRRKIASFFADRGRDDLLLLHFSCHGLKDDSGQLYFAATDTEVAHLDATALSAEFVSRQMTRSRSRKVVALLDCCYSGAIARGLRFRGGDQVDLDDHLGGHGRVILTASSAMEYAFEGEELTGSGNPSVFTTAVVKGLETGEADRDQDRRISVEELYDYVCEQVREITPDQSPNMLSHLEGELYVARSSYVAPLPPAELPVELREAIDSTLAGVREGAVTELERLLASHDASLAQAAGRALGRLTEDDSRRVAAAAGQALAGAPEVVEQAPAAARTPAPAPAPSRVEPHSSGARKDRVAPVLSTLGALVVLASLTLLANDPFIHSLMRIEILGLTAAIAAAAIPLLRLAGLVAPESVAHDVTAAALSGIPLGLAAGAGGLKIEIGSPFPPAITAVGAMLLLIGALSAFLGRGPLLDTPRTINLLLLVAGVVLALSLSAPWYDGGSASYQLLWPAEYVVWAAVAITLASAGLGLRRRGSPWLLAAYVPAMGAAAIAVVLSVSDWTAVETKDGGYGLPVALIAGVLVVLAGSARLLRARDA